MRGRSNQHNIAGTHVHHWELVILALMNVRDCAAPTCHLARNSLLLYAAHVRRRPALCSAFFMVVQRDPAQNSTNISRVTPVRHFVEYEYRESFRHADIPIPARTTNERVWTARHRRNGRNDPNLEAYKHMIYQPYINIIRVAETGTVMHTGMYCCTV